MRIRKSKKASLENKRIFFFQIGLIVSLAFIFLAFEWTATSVNKIDWTYDPDHFIDEEIIKITVHEKKIEMPKPKIIRPIKIIDDIDLDDEDIFVDVEITDETINNLDFLNDEEDIDKEDPVIYKYVQFRPEFPGGEVELYRYLAQNLKYTQTAREVGIEGVAYVSFIVWNDGSIKNVKIVRGLGAGLDEEVIKIIKAMPMWSPGIQNGKEVNVEYLMPIKFDLQ